jgi:uncharacterized membrane protein YedE/YeeE
VRKLALAAVAGAIFGAGLLASRLILARGRPVLDSCFYLPEQTQLDARLLGGAAVFGVGWGIAGFCPGPAIVSAASGLTAGLVFVAAMVIGMLISPWRDR